ncbi:MAG: hypothetical protein HKO66_13685 [Saprospiraceae bacterium]|nr:hypothetical protein [Bacteroidia bacterium]NNE14741.1 hypothetical protein [Saprospiraceae bacterium]NNL93286.1 hypothetical protein [Saprospiraceae bacterium]
MKNIEVNWKAAIVFSLMTMIIVFSNCSEDTFDIYVNIDQELDELITSHSPTGNSEFYILPYTNQYDLIPQDPKNPLSSSKVELGKFLFFETGIAMDAKKPSGMATYSCASCHIPEAGFRSGRMQGIADGGMGYGEHGSQRYMNDNYVESELDVQAARPLSLVNVAFVKNTFWNGQFGSKHANVGTEHLWALDEGTKRNNLGYEAIETQNFEGIHSHRMLVTKDLMDAYGYTALFDEAFPEFNEQSRYSNFTASLALSAYIRSIIAYKAPFQEWLKGNEDALSLEEKKGAKLFFGKANCTSCHYNQNLGSNEFHALGAKDMDHHEDALNRDPKDKRNLGRGGFTNEISDLYKFKVPGIYNLKGTPFYFHGSSKTSVKDVVKYKLNAETENPRVNQTLISNKLNKITLTEVEIDNLVSFLEKSLHDPDLNRYKPTHIKSGLCYPNNDVISQSDLDCQ